MRHQFLKSLLCTGALAGAALLASGAASAQTAVIAPTNGAVALTAARMTATLPDGNAVPMWGYCATGTCKTTWAPAPTIIVPTDPSSGYGTLTINLTNSLRTPTSIVILGQLGGGLGSGGAAGDVPRVQFPQHAASQPITWPSAGAPTDPVFNPPAQGARARAMAPEAAAAGTQTYSWTKLRPGTYLYETGSLPSLQAPMGLYGVIVVTQAPAASAGDAYPLAGAKARVPYDADATLLFSEIDPRQNAAVDAAALAGADVTKLFSDASCTTATPCYPPAVNYAPTYFLINGQAFDASQPAKSGFPLSGNAVLTPGGGNVLLRLVNAGLRTHVPSVVGLPAPLQIVAEDGFVAPGNPKQQSQVLMAAGKTMDVVFKPAFATGSTTSYATSSFPVFDRALSLSASNITNQTAKANGGMIGFIAIQPAGVAVGVAGTTTTPAGAAVPAGLTAVLTPDFYATPIGTPLSGNVLKNDVNVLTAGPVGAITGSQGGKVTLNSDGSFTYTPPTATFVGVDTFFYTGNGGTKTALVTIKVGSTTLPIANADTFTSKVATTFRASAPGVLANDTAADTKTVIALNAVLVGAVDANGLGAGAGSCGSVLLSPDGAFTATPKATVTKPTSCSFQYKAKDGLGAVSSAAATVTVNFTPGSGLAVTVQDTQADSAGKKIVLTDYSWVIEEDTTYFHDPKTPAAQDTLATNFHKSYMPVVATGCTGPISCGSGNFKGGVAMPARTVTLPSDVTLDPTKRYYISVLPGDADQGDAAYNADGTVTVNAFGHAMGGVSVPSGWAAAAKPAPANVLVARNALPPAQLSVIVFEDNNPTNGGVDANERGLGGFTINLYDTRGSSGDPAGQMTYDLSGMPLTNSLANTLDSVTHENLCPMNAPSGTIITCPEVIIPSTGQVSKLAGMALIKNLNPGRLDVWATPGADRAVNGENWVQVSTLEGTHATDTFVKPGEKSYWQEFGPPGFHSFIGFVNPKQIDAVNKAQGGTATVNGRIPSLHMDRPTPSMANLNNSCATGVKGDGTPVNPNDPSCRATLNSTTCYVGVNSVGGTGATVALTTCDQNGNFSLKNVPAGSHSLVIWDQWLDQIISYKALTVNTTDTTVNVGDIPVFSWFTRVEQSAFVDLNQNGVRDANEPGVSQIPMNVRFRDGSVASFLTTDSDGSVTANELFPLFNWYVIESDTTRYTGTGVNVTYDSGGKPDSLTTTVTDLNGASVTKDFRGVLNSTESVPLPAALQVPGATYTTGKTSRVDPGTVLTEGHQGFINQTASIDWGKRPYVPGETGGITGLVYYASTRGFDDPSLEVQFSWEPAVPRVPVNLYQEVTNADGSVSRVLVDQTTTWSWDDATAALHCPGDPLTDPYVTGTLTAAQQYKCYDGQHNFNQVQPTVYDGRYRFPTANCKICQANPANDPTVLPGKPAGVTYPNVLPAGKYVVELVVPEGYEIVKEEDKNILIGDAWIAPYEATQFLGVGNIFIVPDQATLNDANVVGSNLASAFPPCVGALHRVPDYLTLFPGNGQIAPYAGQDRPLCDHKEVLLTDQSQAGADFQVFTQTPVAGHITGIMLNDAAAEFDPYSPAFLEKASLPNAPISVRDYNGVEIARVYNDKWGTFNNLVPSTWEANVPNPSGYAPNMLTFCMNDPGPIADASGALDPKTGKVRMVVDPMYNPMFSNFCYVWPSMPGITTYLDTPVLPVSAFASASTYEPVDCAYPNSTPAIFRVDGTGTLQAAPGTVTAAIPSNIGPFVDMGATGTKSLTITALGDVQVANPAYEGPAAVATTTMPTANQPKITRHYGFGTAPGTVTVNGTRLTVTSWTDLAITATVGNSVSTGELVITTADGKQSVDTVTVTIANSKTDKGYKAPWYVGPPDLTTSTATSLKHPIQDAIDNAAPGDLIIVDAGNYSELVVMDHPVRLQGVGAAAVVINAAKYPNQKIDDWRTRINAAFGLDNQGNTLPGTPAVDPLPGQEITGGVILLEPSVLATEEGAGITVLAKGYEADGVTLLTTSKPDCGVKSNFRCATSRIDGLSVTGSDAGGGIYVNGWAHNLEIANNRVFGNAGSLAAGIRIGQPYLEGQTLPAGTFTGFKYDEKVNVHNNAITNNGTVEGTPAAGATAAAAGGAGGGVSICAGSDGYKLTGNWICGNYSSSDGGGVGHIGLSTNGVISNNKILFNESYNQTGAQNGGGLVIEGEGATGTTLGLGTGNVTVDANLIQGNFARAGSGGGVRLASVNGADAADSSQQWKVTLTNNMIVNNVAAYAGAGISLADTLFSTVVNNTIAMNDSTGIAGSLFSTQVGNRNTGPTTAVPNPAGISSELTSAPLLNSLPVPLQGSSVISNPHLVNDIVWHNRSFFFNMNGDTTNGGSPAQLSPSNNWTDAFAPPAPIVPPPNGNGCATGEKYWDVGVVGDQTLPGNAPANLVYNGAATQTGAGTTASPRIVTVTTTAALPWPVGATVYVTIGGVTGNANSVSRYNGGFVITITAANKFQYQPSANGTANPGLAALTVTYTPPAAIIPVATTNVLSTAASPNLAKVYCNASRTLPGAQFEPGTPFQPAFNISVAATLDESGNFVDLHFGPLSVMDQATGKVANGDYHIATAAGSAYGAGARGAGIPPTDYDSQNRGNGRIDTGADQYLPSAPVLTSITPASGLRGTTVAVTLSGSGFTAATNVTVTGGNVTVNAITVLDANTMTANFVIAAAATASARNVAVVTPGGTSNNATFTVLAPPPPTLTSVAPATGRVGTTVAVTLTGTGLTGTSAIAVSGGTGGNVVSVTSIVVVSDSTVTANFVIPAGAAANARNVTVTTPAGNVTLNNAFAVTLPPPPVLSGITTSAPGVRGTTVTVTLTGTNLTGTTAINVAGNGITVNNLVVLSDTTVTATFTISTTANLGARTLTVTTAGVASTTTASFTVVGATLTGISPPSATPPATGTLVIPVTLTGTSLTGATQVTVSGSRVTPAIISVTSTAITANFTIQSNAARSTTARTVTVTTPIGQVTIPFTVN